MSMHSWTEEGYGYPLLNKDNLNTIKKFLIANGYIDEDYRQELMEMDNEYDIEYSFLGEPLPNIIANIINETEGENFISGYNSDGDTNQEMMLGISPSYPWYCKPRSREECDVILNRWAKVLGITEKPDYFTAEYFG